MPQLDLTPLVEKSLAAIRKAQSDFDAAIAEATQLVRQAAEQHAEDNLEEARDSIVIAGNILYNWVGDSDAVSEMEEALWEGDDEAWEARVRETRR